MGLRVVVELEGRGCENRDAATAHADPTAVQHRELPPGSFFFASLKKPARRLHERIFGNSASIPLHWTTRASPDTVN